MKYKHYAPKADVYMVDASAEDYAAFLHTHSEAAALCFNEDVPYLKKSGACPTAAPQIPFRRRTGFSRRSITSMRSAQRPFTPVCRAKCGVGLAVYNRLIRACAFRIVTPNEQLVIGLTGQTGAGKSTVAKQLKARGCVIIDCDAVTHDPSLYAGTCLTELQNAFGRAIIKRRRHVRPPSSRKPRVCKRRGQSEAERHHASRDLSASRKRRLPHIKMQRSSCSTLRRCLKPVQIGPLPPCGLRSCG